MQAKEEWKMFGEIMASPYLIIVLLLTLTGLSSPLFINKSYQGIIYTLQVLASIFAGVAGGIFSDKYKNYSGNTLLSKKGSSAVRNLALIRHKARNIVRRIKSHSDPAETINLVELLEKDIANATREWNDIIPGITDLLDVNYDAIEEKEAEFDTILAEKESLRDQLEKQGKDKDNALQQLLKENEKKLGDINKEIAKLQVSAESSTRAGIIDLSKYSSRQILVGGTALQPIDQLTQTTCSKCGKVYIPLTFLNSGLCESCSPKATPTRANGFEI